MLDAKTVTWIEAFDFFNALYDSTYKEQIDFLVPKIDPDKDILDIGANIGYYSYSLLKKIPMFRGIVHLFEPVEHLAKLCRMTMDLFEGRIKRHIWNIALSDKNGTEILYVDTAENMSNIGWNTFIKEQTQAGMIPEKVESRRLDNLIVINNPDNIGFIKIDVEGAEYKVLDGMIPMFLGIKELPVMVVEVGWGKDRHPHWDRELLMFRTFEKMGYRIVGRIGQEIDLNNLQGTQDIIFLPERYR